MLMGRRVRLIDFRDGVPYWEGMPIKPGTPFALDPYAVETISMMPSSDPGPKLRPCLAMFVLLLSAAFPVAALAAAGERGGQAEAIERAFADPPKPYRPFVRWWWNGARVTPPEAIRQLELLAQNGVGGVEMNTLQMPQEVPEEFLNFAEPLEWLSPEWCAVLEAASTRARALGMTPDVIIGSGWPFGGEFLPVDFQAKRVQTVRVEVPGGTTYHATLDELAHHQSDEPLSKQRHRIEPPGRREVLSMLLLERGAAQVRVVPVDLAGAYDAAAKTVSVEVPAGEHELLVALLETGYTKVKLGAPGASGPLLDHFNRAAVEDYLLNMSGKIELHLGRRLGELVRATFTDSMELEGANWTNDFARAFQARRGYDVLPWLPLVLTDRDSSWGAELSRDVRDVRYDFFHTIVELFDERYLATYREWSSRLGLETRMQAYGPTIHPLHGSMGVSIPEGESWLWRNSELQPPGLNLDSTVANKYVSSGANLTGKRTVTFEAMTNPTAVTRETLHDFKRLMDLSLLDGVNHPILHGFNCSPREAGFPGWVRFGVYFHEQVPYWDHWKLFSDYASRLGVVFRHSEYQAKVAVLPPLGEEWETHGLLYQPFPEPMHIWYQYLMTDAFQMQGVGVDFVSEEVIQAADVGAAKLRFNTRAYDVIVLQSVTALDAKTAEQLAAFAAGGGKVVFVGGVPERSLGYIDRDRNARRVVQAMQQVQQAGGLRYEAPPVPENHIPHTRRNFRGMPQDYRDLLKLTAKILEDTRLAADVEISKVTSDLQQVLHVDDAGNHYYFFANANEEATVDTIVRFRTGQGRPVVMDALTGSIGGTLPEEPDGYRVLLRPAESLLVRLGGAGGSTDHRDQMATVRRGPGRVVDRFPLRGEWRVRFHTANDGPTFTRTMGQLGDLAESSDAEVAHFGGKVVYETTLDLDQVPEYPVLNLGRVHGTSQLSVNGRDLGVVWYGMHEYHLDGYLQEGENDIRIEVTTTLANHLRSLQDNPTAQRLAGWSPKIRMGLEQNPVLEARE